MALFCCADSLSTSNQVQLFTSGLMEPVRTDVELQNPGSLQLAMTLARAYEKRHLFTSSISKPVVRLPNQRRHVLNSTSSSVATPVIAKSTSDGTMVPAAPNLPRRQLTAAQMAERRRVDLCFNCEENFIPDTAANVCFFLRLFLMSPMK